MIQLNKIVPRSIIVATKLIYDHIYLRGQTKISQKGFCLDGQGQPIPWITYPATDFLSKLDFSGSSIFEYGSGSSTLWWSARARQVTSVEFDKNWYENVRQEIPENATLIYSELGQQFADQILNFSNKFDIIVLDGGNRYLSVEPAVHKLAATGFIILDNTEWCPRTEQALREKDFTQIDFCGYTPLNSFPAVTSIFFGPECTLLRKRNSQNWSTPGLKTGRPDLAIE